MPHGNLIFLRYTLYAYNNNYIHSFFQQKMHLLCEYTTAAEQTKTASTSVTNCDVIFIEAIGLLPDAIVEREKRHINSIIILIMNTKVIPVLQSC